MGSYPVRAYRETSGQRSGSQRQSGTPRGRSGVPSSGRVPGKVIPFPKRPAKPSGPFGKRIVPPRPLPLTAVQRTALGGLAKAGLKFIPWVGAALTAWELYQWWQSNVGEQPMTIPGFELCRTRDIWSACKGTGQVLTVQPNMGNVNLVPGTCPGSGSDYCVGGALHWTAAGPGHNSMIVHSGFHWLPNVVPLFGGSAAFYVRYALTGNDVLPTAWAPYPFERAFNWPGNQNIPYRYPQLDPLSMPINQPLPVPSPLPFEAIPHRQPNEDRAPDEQTQRGPEPRVRPYVFPRAWPWYFPRPGPRTAPQPQPRPRTRPGDEPRPMEQPVPKAPPAPLPFVPLRPPVDVEPTPARPDPPPVVVLPSPGRPQPYAPPAGPSFPKRPGPKTKEKKVKVGPGWVGKAYGMVTEIEDFTNALYYAMPAEFRWVGQRVPLHIKLQLVVAGWLSIDWNQAMINLLLNEVGDTIGGHTGRVSKGANKIIGRPVGLQFGPLH